MLVKQMHSHNESGGQVIFFFFIESEKMQTAACACEVRQWMVAEMLLWHVVRNELALSSSQDVSPTMTLARQCKGGMWKH